MNELDVMALARLTLGTGLVVGLPIISTVAVVGLAMSLVMALTQIQEQSLSFVPKLVAGAVVALASGPWMLRKLTDMTVQILSSLGNPGP